MFYLVAFGVGYFLGKGGMPGVPASISPGQVLNTQPAGTPSTTPTYTLPAGYRVDANGNVYSPSGQILSASSLTQFLKTV